MAVVCHSFLYVPILRPSLQFLLFFFFGLLSLTIHHFLSFSCRSSSLVVGLLPTSEIQIVQALQSLTSLNPLWNSMCYPEFTGL